MKETSIQKAIRDFAKKGFERSEGTFQGDGIHRHVLKNKYDNFIKMPPSNFKFHRWAGSLTSSQAFAYNIFSGVGNAEFEYNMWALDYNPLHKACVDVAIEDEKGDIDMYEVKMFEFATSVGKNQIFHKEGRKYFNPKNYNCSTQEIAESFTYFIESVVNHFKNRSMYGEGIKQLCCHLLGIINEKTKYDKLCDKKVRLHSLCFDHNFGSHDFTQSLESYRKILKEDFFPIVNNYLEKINMHDQIEYCGYLGASDYIENNIELLGIANYDYVKKRYFNG